MAYSEDTLQAAIEAVRSNHLSQKKAAAMYGIPRTSLSGRLHGKGTKEAQYESMRLFPRSQEDHIIQWILNQESLGYAPSHSAVRAIANELLKRSGHEATGVGKNWLDRFLQRHQDEIISKRGQRQEAARFDGFTHKAVD